MWVEAVPNFSEGQDPRWLEEVAHRARVSGVSVLGVEGDVDHNRSVLSIAGPGEQVVSALMSTADLAVKTIDLRRQRGIHPRMGAVDVVPIIPLGETPMEYAVELTKVLGRRLAEELGLPVFLYEQSAQLPNRRKLEDVRRGGFERLAERMRTDAPDFGPSAPHPSAGAVAVGARWALVAFNCYLSTTDLTIARAVARRVRASGGGLAGVKALGLHPHGQGAVQVSMNLVDYPTTTLPEAVEMVRQEAEQYGVTVTRSELVGLMPLRALLDTTAYYLNLPDLDAGRVVELTLLQEGMKKVEVRLPEAKKRDSSQV